LKQEIFNGYNACDVCDGHVIMFNPNFFECSIDSKLTWLPCPSIINNYQLMRDVPPGNDFLKKDKNSLNMKITIHVFFFIAIWVSSL
jgi:hypothetical protein